MFNEDGNLDELTDEQLHAKAFGHHGILQLGQVTTQYLRRHMQETEGVQQQKPVPPPPVVARPRPPRQVYPEQSYDNWKVEILTAGTQKDIAFRKIFKQTVQQYGLQIQYRYGKGNFIIIPVFKRGRHTGYCRQTQTNTRAPVPDYLNSTTPRTWTPSSKPDITPPSGFVALPIEPVNFPYTTRDNKLARIIIPHKDTRKVAHKTNLIPKFIKVDVSDKQILDLFTTAKTMATAILHKTTENGKTEEGYYVITVHSPNGTFRVSHIIID